MQRDGEMLKHKQLHRSVRKIRSTKSTYTELVQYVLLGGIIAVLIHIILIKWRTRINSIYSVIQLFSCLVVHGTPCPRTYEYIRTYNAIEQNNMCSPFECCCPKMISVFSFQLETKAHRCHTLMVFIIWFCLFLRWLNVN